MSLVTAFKKERIRYDFPVPAPPLKNTLPPDNMMSNAFFVLDLTFLKPPYVFNFVTKLIWINF